MNEYRYRIITLPYDGSVDCQRIYKEYDEAVLCIGGKKLHFITEAEETEYTIFMEITDNDTTRR